MFSRYVQRLENSKKIDNKLLQKESIYETIYELSEKFEKDELINKEFSKCVSDYLSESKFSIINNVLLNNELIMMTDSIGYGDSLSFKFDNDLLIKSIKYQTSDKRDTVSLFNKGNKYFIVNRIKKLDGTIKDIIHCYVKDNNETYECSKKYKVIIQNDGIVTYIVDSYEYDRNNNELLRKTSCTTKENNEVVGESSIINRIDEKDFIVDEGKFYTIEKKDSLKKLLLYKNIERDAIEKEF